jgi:hypothetical protein
MEDIREYAKSKPKSDFPYLPTSLTPAHRKGDMHKAFHAAEKRVVG